MKKAGIYKFLILVASVLIVLALNISMFKIIPTFLDSSTRYIMGGTVYDQDDDVFSNMESQYIKPDDSYVERFLRPSGAEPMEKKYFVDEEGKESYIKNFKMPSEIVRAYYDVLSDASNMGDKSGGCGTIGMAGIPYPAAYDFLSDDLKKGMTLDKFIKSFEGIGHINLLKLIDIPAVKIDGKVNPRVFVEIETIEGSDTPGKTYFAYYYGYVTTTEDKVKGWRISSIQLKSEDFLCHAYHGWWHDAGTIVDVIYGKRCGVVDKVIGVEEDGDFRNVLARGKDGKQYRFMFVRITNGADIELRQYINEDGKWKDIYINPDQCKK